MAYPFLSDSLVQTSLPPISISQIPKDKLYNSTHRMFPLLKHLFPVTNKYPPTSLAEVQSHAIVKFWTSPELLDVDSEFDAIVSRYERLKDRFEGNDFRDAGCYFMVDPPAQYRYRGELYTLAYGDDKETLKKYMAPDWHKEMYLHNSLLRAEWEEMKRTGEAKDFVKGVGEVSRDEWKELMYRLLERVLEKRDIKNQ